MLHFDQSIPTIKPNPEATYRVPVIVQQLGTGQIYTRDGGSLPVVQIRASEVVDAGCVEKAVTEALKTAVRLDPNYTLIKTSLVDGKSTLGSDSVAVLDLVGETAPEGCELSPAESVEPAGKVYTRAIKDHLMIIAPDFLARVTAGLSELWRKRGLEPSGTKWDETRKLATVRAQERYLKRQKFYEAATRPDLVVEISSEFITDLSAQKCWRRETSFNTESDWVLPNGCKPAAALICATRDGRVVARNLVEDADAGPLLPMSDKGAEESLAECAQRAFYEQTGMRAQITGMLGDVTDDGTHTRVFVGQVVEADGNVLEAADLGTESLVLAPASHLTTLFKPKVLVGIANDHLSELGRERQSMDPLENHEQMVQDQDNVIKRAKFQRECVGQGGPVAIDNVEELTNLIRYSQCMFISPEYNPEHPELSKKFESPEFAVTEMERRLTALGFRYTKVEGFYGKPETSFMVFLEGEASGLANAANSKSFEELVALGEEFGQDSVLYSNWGRQMLYYTTGENRGRVYYGAGARFHHSALPTDFYSRVKCKSGKKYTFRLDIDFEFLYSGVAEVTKRLAQLVRNKYERFVVHNADGELPQMTPQTPFTGTKTLYLVRGCERYNGYAEQLAEACGAESTVILSEDATIAAISSQHPDWKWPQIRDEMIRRGPGACKTAIKCGYGNIVFASMGKRPEFMQVYVDAAKDAGYDVEMIMVSEIADDKRYPWMKRHVDEYKRNGQGTDKIVTIGEHSVPQVHMLAPENWLKVIEERAREAK